MGGNFPGKSFPDVFSITASFTIARSEFLIHVNYIYREIKNLRKVPRLKLIFLSRK